MSQEDDPLLKLIFPSGLPEEWALSQNFNKYITKLGTQKLEELSKEVNDLQDEKISVLTQTQNLAVSNYKSFIETAECSRNLSKQFNIIDARVKNLLEDIPRFEDMYEKFAEKSGDISNLRKLNSLTLTKNAQLLEVLELPQLMHSLIEDGLYDDALELSNNVKKLQIKHSDIPIFSSILNDVDKEWKLMLKNLLNSLKHEITLSKCLQIMGHIRRMAVYTETELQLKFLQNRNYFLQSCLSSIPNDNVNIHINKVIETTRIHLFNIVTQYRAIFNDDIHNPLSMSKHEQVHQNSLFYGWINEKLAEFLKVLENDLSRGVHSIESILGQCMYFGLSFSKVGCDFRTLLIPIFTKQIANDFKQLIDKASANFEQNLEKFTLINKYHSNVPWKVKIEDHLQPPESLLEFYPLADYLNNVLTALNKLRLCAPMSLIQFVTDVLQNSLIFVSKLILLLHSQEKQAFNTDSRDAFSRLCMSFADDLIPFVQKCLHIIYPPSLVALFVGISVRMLENESLSYFNRTAIIQPIQHLLPVKSEPTFTATIENKDLEVTD